MRIQITAPKSTPINAPVVVTQKIFDKPRISRIVIRIPFGHSYLTGVRIFDNRGGAMVPDGNSNTPWIVGDRTEVSSAQTFQLDGPEYGIRVEAYNLDDTYSHTFYIDLE